VPRGREEGMPSQLAAIVTDFALDSLTGDPDCGSLSFCGALDELFPDLREMGYPFNRSFGATRSMPCFAHRTRWRFAT
jgi:hypothetical protein